MYNVDFGELQQSCTFRGRFNNSLYLTRLGKIQARLQASFDEMSEDDIYRDQLVASLVSVEMEIDHCDDEE